MNEGHDIIEAALAKAIKAAPTDAPFGMDEHEARLYHMGAAVAYQHALEMIPRV